MNCVCVFDLFLPPSCRHHRAQAETPHVEPAHPAAAWTQQEHTEGMIRMFTQAFPTHARALLHSVWHGTSVYEWLPIWRCPHLMTSFYLSWLDAWYQCADPWLWLVVKVAKSMQHVLTPMVVLTVKYTFIKRDRQLFRNPHLKHSAPLYNGLH